MVKCQIRNTKERKKISGETKFSCRDLKGMKQVEFTAHCPQRLRWNPRFQTLFPSWKIPDGCWWRLHLRASLSPVTPCSSSVTKPWCWALWQKVWGCFNWNSEVFTISQHACCWLHNLMQYSTVISWEIVWWLGCKSCGWVREWWKKEDGEGPGDLGNFSCQTARGKE